MSVSCSALIPVFRCGRHVVSIRTLFLPLTPTHAAHPHTHRFLAVYFLFFLLLLYFIIEYWDLLPRPLCGSNGVG